MGCSYSKRRELAIEPSPNKSELMKKELRNAPMKKDYSEERNHHKINKIGKALGL